MMQSNIHKSPLFRFLIVGGASTIINYSAYFFLYSAIGVSYSLAFAVGFLVGVAFGYVLNKRWTFGMKEVSTPSIVMKYVAVYGISLALGLLFIQFLVEIATIPPLPANFCTILLTTCTNFVGTRYLVFKS
jgi:putative flippase GtrA